MLHADIYYFDEGLFFFLELTLKTTKRIAVKKPVNIGPIK